MNNKVFMLAVCLLFACSLGAQEHVTTAQFKERVWDYTANSQQVVLKSKVPVILDFYADWCRPCRMLAPELQALQKQYGNRLKVYKINVDEEKELARMFNANALPTIYFLTTDNQGTYVQGYRTQDELSQIVEAYFFRKNAEKKK